MNGIGNGRRKRQTTVSSAASASGKARAAVWSPAAAAKAGLPAAHRGQRDAALGAKGWLDTVICGMSRDWKWRLANCCGLGCAHGSLLLPGGNPAGAAKQRMDAWWPGGGGGGRGWGGGCAYRNLPGNL